MHLLISTCMASGSVNFPVRMAGRAGRQFDFRDAGRKMTRTNGLRLVVVTAVTGIFDISAGMAGRTGQFTLISMGQGKTMVTKLGRMPGIYGMAKLALETEEPGVNGRFAVAGTTSSRRPPKSPVFMTGCAFQGSM